MRKGLTPVPNFNLSYLKLKSVFAYITRALFHHARHDERGVSLPCKRGFTLIELLIVIAILAILTSAVVIILNPAQLLAQARDSQRFSDLTTVVDAVSYYLSTTTSTSPLVTTTTKMVSTTTVQFVQADSVVNSSTSVGVGGWVAVALRNAEGGSPIATLPFDPINNASYYYAYCGLATNATFEVNANLESQKYSDRKTTDGGNRSDFYEVGSNLSC